MPATKITELTAISTVNTTVDPLAIVDVSDTTQASSGTTKKITVSQIDAAIFGASGSKAIVVDNVAALKALTVSGIADGQLYITRGYYSDNDGGQGTYIYDSASAATDNGGTVIAPTAGAGRFLLQCSGPVNVKQFGAKTDGSDATTAIQAAITYASSISGSVFFPAGETFLANLVIAGTQNVTLLFEGGQWSQNTAQALLPFNQSNPAITLGTASSVAKYINIVGLRSWGRTGDTKFMLLQYAVECNFDRMMIGNFSEYGLKITSVNSGGTYFNNFNNCHFTNYQSSTSYSVYLDYGTVGFNNQAVFNNCSWEIGPTGETGVYCYNSTGSRMVHTFSNVWIEGGPSNTTRNAPVKIQGPCTLQCTNFFIDGTESSLALQYSENEDLASVVRGSWQLQGYVKQGSTLSAQTLTNLQTSAYETYSKSNTTNRVAFIDRPATLINGLENFASSSPSTYLQRSGSALNVVNSSGGVSISPSTTLAVDSTTFVVDCANDRVGVGTATPSVKFHVFGTGSQTIAVERSGATIPGRFEIISGGSTNLLRAETAKPLLFEMGTGSEIARFDVDGNFYVGMNTLATSSQKTIHIGNGTAPTANPLGGVLYVESGALKYRGSSGTVTTIANA
jgi:hypothetical protein